MGNEKHSPLMGSNLPHCDTPAPYPPVLHAGVAPNGLLHVGMALRGLTGPGPLPGLDWALGDVVAIASLSTAASTTTSSSSSTPTTAATSSTSPYSSTASSRGRGSAKATKSVLAATLEVVLSAGERHLHPDPGFRCHLFWERHRVGDGGGGLLRGGGWRFLDNVNNNVNNVCELLGAAWHCFPLLCCCGNADMLVQKAQTGQVREFEGAGKSPASNMTHTEWPSAPSLVCWCKPGKRALWVFTLTGCIRAALQKSSGSL